MAKEKKVSSTSTILLYFLAIWVPFVPVFLRRGCGADLLINVLLCVLGWIPGVLHAWYIIAQSEKMGKKPASLRGAEGVRA